MALLTFPHFSSHFSLLSSHFPSLSFSFPNTRSFSSTRRYCSMKATGTAILWFKHDLRTDDHPALLAASAFPSLVPIYVFDHRILSRFSDETLELVLLAVEDLRKSLKDRGSDLVIRFGNAENVIQQLATEVKATCVFAEQEVEYELRFIIDVVKQRLKSVSVPQGSPRIELWRTPFYDIKDLENLPASYDEFKKLRLSVTTPLQLSVSKLPGAEIELDWGVLPSYDDIKGFLTSNQQKSGEKWSLMKETSAETILRRKVLKSGNNIERSSRFGLTQSRERNGSVFVTQKGNIVGGSTNNVLNALAAYLRYLEGTARDDWQEVHEKVRASESRNGASFIGLFGPALSLGIISRRKVHYEAIKYEKERNAGFLSPFGYSAATIAAAVDAVCSMEWYWLLALKNQKNNHGIHSTRIWKWKGFLIQYSVAGEDGPAILLVHGFGAFWEHYRDNIHGLAESGNRVWAITILGFGKSEKPNVVYTELLWAELLRDFIVDIVGEPVHLVGNSIGGYLVAIVARVWSDLIKSIVLINSAGNVIPRYSFIPLSTIQDRQTSGASWLGSRILVFYLRLRTQELLKKCYPTRVERADDFLIII
ncbi:cryptochrome DASH, chloroplastic/mitochondrial isoform X2 [Glycine soja]|uniref:cryptochrome DASH, chloroplastic/mitochondrial isoform X2 n=1 Tax=Glycine soja TaxID=3848 RepID=UPI00103953BF|nr:cryptochrome DASH, chloroplastic/mitochondrial isoform X2 [Glycine soja]